MNYNDRCGGWLCALSSEVFSGEIRDTRVGVVGGSVSVSGGDVVAVVLGG